MKDALIESFTGFIAAKESGRDLKGMVTLKSAKLILAALHENKALKAQIAALQGTQKPDDTMAYMMPNVFASLVNTARDVALEYKNAQCLRDALSRELKGYFILTRQPKPVVVLSDGWIKCSERMPEVGVSVLVCHPTDGPEKTTHTFSYGRWWDTRDSYAGMPDNYFSHWMPIPAGPKPESESGIVVKDGE